uniref:Putative trypsin-like serine protease n=1 Tax=Ixodes ricinus TaxID=34613 RepID=A0A147BCW0_IXORI
MMRVRRRLWIFLLSISVYHSAPVDGSRERREACRARHLSRDELVDGLCMPVHECLQSLKDVGKLKFPLFCGVRVLLPIVCCPQPQRSPPTTTTTSTTPTTTTTTTTSTTPAPPVMGPCQTQTGQPGTCIPLFDCKPLEEQVSQGKYPPICSIQMRIPYACCPRNETPQAEPIQVDAVARAVKVSELVYENGIFCGKRRTRPGHHVFVPVVHGGKNAAHGLYPFAVAVYRDRVSIRNFWCGGTLITKTVVLSAAHCFFGTLNDTTYLARIGGVNISEGSNDSFVQRNVVSVHVHPDYNERQHYADVALLLLDRSGRQSDLKRPFACLPDAVDAEPDTGQAVVLGWGHDVFGGRLQTHLQEARVPLVANDLCNEAYRSLASYEREFPRGISGDFICAGNVTDGGVDACQQDSGGPLVTNSTRDGRNFFEVVGIVSFGVGCGTAQYPGVYAKVATFRDWILNKMVEVIPDSQINFV